MIARVIAKKYGIPTPPTDEPDEEHCYNTISGKYYMIPVHVARPKVVEALEKEFDERCNKFQEQFDKQFAAESKILEDKERLAKADLELERLRKKNKAAEESLQAALLRVQELESAQISQGSTQSASA